MCVAFSILGHVIDFGLSASPTRNRGDAAGLDAPAAAYLPVSLPGVHVTHVEQGAGHLHGDRNGRARGDLLDVEVASPLARPSVVPALPFRSHADHAQHRLYRE